MRFLVGAAMTAFISATPAGAADPSPYHHIENPPDPAAQLAEMIGIYDEVCLRGFPDDRAVARAMAARGATELSKKEVKSLLRDDPGVGWRLAGRVAEYRVTVEAPPYHACGVRTMAAAPFPDMQPYRDLAARFEAGKAAQRVGPLPTDKGELRSIGAGEVWRTTRGEGESLLVFTVTPHDELRAKGDDAVEIRFVHQIVVPGAR